MNTRRACAAVVVLVVGVYLLLDGALLVREILIDGVFIGVGVALVLSYFWLIGSYLEYRFQAPREITLMPVLLVLGIIMMIFGAIRVGLPSIELKLSFVLPGAVLVAVPALMIYKAIKGKIRPRPKMVKASPKQTIDAAVYEYVASPGGEISIAECAETLKISQKQVMDAIKRMQKAKRIEIEKTENLS